MARIRNYNTGRPIHSGINSGTSRGGSIQTTGGQHRRNGDVDSLSDTPQGLNGQNYMDSTYAQLLNSNANDDFSKFLASLGINQEKGLNGSQRDDFNKQLLDTMLNYYMTKENRSYNESMRDEQRLYETPANQLARLMGVGISRDAAIQMLSGQGSQPIQSDPAAAGEGVAASESTANAVNNALGIANTVFSGVSAISGLVGLGFSVPQAVQQIQFLKMQNVLTKGQVAAYQSTGQAFSLLNSIGAAAESFGSVSSAAAAIQKAAQDGNQDAVSFISSGGLDAMVKNAPFASQTLSNLYMSERHASDWSRSYDVELRRQHAQLALDQISYDKLLGEINNLGAEFENIVSSTEYNERLQEVAIAQANLLEKQGRTEDANALRAELQNIATETAYDTQFSGKSGLEWLTNMTIEGWYNAAGDISAQANPEIWQAHAQSMLSDYNRLQAYCAFEILRKNASTELAAQYPAMLKMCMAIEDCGVASYVDALVKGKVNVSQSQSAHSFFGGASTSRTWSETDKNVINALNFVGNASSTNEKRKAAVNNVRKMFRISQ